MIGALSGAFSFVSANQVDPWWLSGGIPAANCIAAYQAKGAASLEASYGNLANPGTYNAAPGVAPTWDAVSGWIFNGSNWLNTGITPATNTSVIIRFSDATGTVNRYALGSSNGSNFYCINPNLGASPSALRFIAGGGAGLATAPGLSSGIVTISALNGYRGTTLDGSIPGGAMPAFSIYVGGLNLSGSVFAMIAINVQAVAFYSISISSYIASLNTAMAAL